jgi:prevent-host-death family protein
MKTLSVSEAKMKLSSLVEVVRTTEEEILITKNGSPVAVLISPDEFEGWRETIAIHGEPDLLAEIKKGLVELKRDNAALYTLEELFDD